MWSGRINGPFRRFLWSMAIFVLCSKYTEGVISLPDSNVQVSHTSDYSSAHSAWVLTVQGVSETTFMAIQTCEQIPQTGLECEVLAHHTHETCSEHEASSGTLLHCTSRARSVTAQHS